MNDKLYLIHENDYLDHIDNKLDMYDLLTELVRSVRSDLEAGETARAMRTLCAYENQAHEMYEDWCIPDEYAESGDPDDLAQMMEDELLPADDEDEDGDSSAALRLVRAMVRMTDNIKDALKIVPEIARCERVIGLLDDYEGPENACAE